MRPWGWHLLVCLLATVPCLAQSPPTQEFQQTYSLAAGKNVHLRSAYGTVHVIGWDRPEVKVDAIKRAIAPAQLGSAEVTVTDQGKELCIATKYPAARPNIKTWFGFTLDLCRDWQNISGINEADLATVDYTISVPRNTAVVILNDNGDVEVEGTTEYVYVDIQKGHLTAHDIAGDCKLYGSYSGVNVTLNALSRNTRIDSAVGPLVVNVGPSISARVHVHGARGVENDFGWQEHSRQMEGTLGDGKVSLDVNSGGGRVEVRKLPSTPSVATGGSKLRRPPVRPK